MQHALLLMQVLACILARNAVFRRRSCARPQSWVQCWCAGFRWWAVLGAAVLLLLCKGGWSHVRLQPRALCTSAAGSARRARTPLRGGTSRGPRRGSAWRELNHRDECCSWAPAKEPRMLGRAAAPNDIHLNMRWRAVARRCGGIGEHSDAFWSRHWCRKCGSRVARRSCGHRASPQARCGATRAFPRGFGRVALTAVSGGIKQRVV
jgi:hypothetical protein